MIISLIHPSRSRPDKSINTIRHWLSKSGLDNVRFVVSVDTTDPEVDSYIDLYAHKYLREGDQIYQMVVSDNRSVVEATNVACNYATGDILIYLSEDFKCPENWGQLILKEFEGVTEPRLIKVDDCLQPFHVKVLTIPIMNRALYEKLGYFWHPDYKSMFVDEDLYHTAQKLGALKMCPHLKFPHEHVSIGKAENDETYRRSAANWEQGKAVFARRKAAGFPL